MHGWLIRIFCAKLIKIGPLIMKKKMEMENKVYNDDDDDRQQNIFNQKSWLNQAFVLGELTGRALERTTWLYLNNKALCLVNLAGYEGGDIEEKYNTRVDSSFMGLCAWHR